MSTAVAFGLCGSLKHQSKSTTAEMEAAEWDLALSKVEAYTVHFEDMRTVIAHPLIQAQIIEPTHANLNCKIQTSPTKESYTLFVDVNDFSATASYRDFKAYMNIAKCWERARAMSACRFQCTTKPLPVAVVLRTRRPFN